MTEWPTTFPENLGAGARKLHQERNRRLTGAALYAKVTVECRKVMAEDYGIPESEYDAEMQEPVVAGVRHAAGSGGDLHAQEQPARGQVRQRVPD